MVANYAFCGRICEFLEMTDKQILDEITKGIQKIHNSYIDVRQVKAWEGAIPNLRKVFCEIDENIWFVFEYKLPFSCERIDLVLLGKDENDKSIAIIGELKGWDKVEQVDDLVVKVRNEIFQHPELQLSNYLGKLLFSHTSSNYFKFVGFIWLYNLSHGNLSINKHKFFCKDSHHEVTEFINKFLSKGIELEEVERFTKGEYLQTSRLFDAIKENYDALLKSATNLVSKYSGIFIPSEEQTIILRKILDDYEKKASKCFLINGEPGSGKTYLAILILLEIIRRAKYTDKEGKNIVALGYRNNRLIYTIREIFKQKECGLDSFIKFYSTRTNSGLAEGDPNKPHFEIVIYDEAQRMTKENIRIAMQRGDITVFFYDETQILNAEEEGFKENFIKTADDLKIPYEVMTLKGVYRVRGGSSYHKFIEDLLNGNPSVYKNSNEYELKLFENITELLEYLKEITRKSYKIALVASFTESPGDRKNKDARTIMNLRVGYPMYSDLEIYKGLYFNGLPLQVYWLMDERIQYPRFWLGDESNILTHCASVYGCQGFEADYVGVIWGRDLVWRNGSWKIGENCQDTIGKPSLKKLIERAREGDIKAEEKAIRLLKNRYRIFLTRGMLGTSIFCEDKETGQLLKKLLLKNK